MSAEIRPTASTAGTTWAGLRNASRAVSRAAPGAGRHSTACPAADPVSGEGSPVMPPARVSMAIRSGLARVMSGKASKPVADHLETDQGADDTSSFVRRLDRASDPVGVDDEGPAGKVQGGGQQCARAGGLYEPQGPVHERFEQVRERAVSEVQHRGLGEAPGEFVRTRRDEVRAEAERARGEPGMEPKCEPHASSAMRGTPAAWAASAMARTSATAPK